MISFRLAAGLIVGLLAAGCSLFLVRITRDNDAARRIVKSLGQSVPFPAYGAPPDAQRSFWSRKIALQSSNIQIDNSLQQAGSQRAFAYLNSVKTTLAPQPSRPLGRSGALRARPRRSSRAVTRHSRPAGESRLIASRRRAGTSVA